MTNFDKMKNTKLGDWFESLNGGELDIIPMAHLTYLVTNCDSCPCCDRCHIIKNLSSSDCQAMLLRWLHADATSYELGDEL